MDWIRDGGAALASGALTTIMLIAVTIVFGSVLSVIGATARRSRSRFWADEASQDRNEAFETLYTAMPDEQKHVADKVFATFGHKSMHA